MPGVAVAVRTTRTAPDVYGRISDFARYPELTDAVREVVIGEPDEGGGLVSTWTAVFRNGLLRWTERDVFEPERYRITFEQLTGDFVTFTGEWRVTPAAPGVPGGATVSFTADFDMGIPSLAAIIDPIAEATLHDNILRILRGLLGDVTELRSPDRYEPADAGTRG